MRRALALLAFGGVLAAPAYGDQHGDALAWLQKMAAAAQRLNYTGTFTYQSGGNSETSRITHLVDAAGEQEKLEVLDGSPREVVRSNDEVKCFLPDDKLVIVEKRGRYKTFPALLPASVSTLGEFYLIRLGDVSRVAGFDSQLILLEPKDALTKQFKALLDKKALGTIVDVREPGEYAEGTGVDATFIRIDGSWTGSSVYWNENAQKFKKYYDMICAVTYGSSREYGKELLEEDKLMEQIIKENKIGDKY